MQISHQWNASYRPYVNHILVLIQQINVQFNVLSENGEIWIIIDVMLVHRHASNAHLWVNVLYVKKILYCLVIFVMLFVRIYWKNITQLIIKRVLLNAKMELIFKACFVNHVQFCAQRVSTLQIIVHYAQVVFTYKTLHVFQVATEVLSPISIVYVYHVEINVMEG